MSDAARNRYARVLVLVTGVVCFATAIYIAIQGVELFSRHVLTSQTTQIPKWLISAIASLALAVPPCT